MQLREEKRKCFRTLIYLDLYLEIFKYIECVYLSIYLLINILFVSADIHGRSNSKFDNLTIINLTTISGKLLLIPVYILL